MTPCPDGNTEKEAAVASAEVRNSRRLKLFHWAIEFSSTDQFKICMEMFCVSKGVYRRTPAISQRAIKSKYRACGTSTLSWLMRFIGWRPALFAHFAGARNLRNVFACIPHGEVRAIRMMKHQRADARLRIHHEALGELHADLFRFQELPNPSLVFQCGARGIAEAVTLPSIP